MLTDDFMGEADMMINSFSPDETHKMSFEVKDAGDTILRRKKKKGLSLGTLEVTFTYSVAETRKVTFVL